MALVTVICHQSLSTTLRNSVMKPHTVSHVQILVLQRVELDSTALILWSSNSLSRTESVCDSSRCAMALSLCMLSHHCASVSHLVPPSRAGDPPSHRQVRVSYELLLWFTALRIMIT